MKDFCLCQFFPLNSYKEAECDLPRVSASSLLRLDDQPVKEQYVPLVCALPALQTIIGDENGVTIVATLILVMVLLRYVLQCAGGM